MCLMGPSTGRLTVTRPWEGGPQQPRHSRLARPSAPQEAIGHTACRCALGLLQDRLSVLEHGLFNTPAPVLLRRDPEILPRAGLSAPRHNLCASVHLDATWRPGRGAGEIIDDQGHVWIALHVLVFQGLAHLQAPDVEMRPVKLKPHGRHIRLGTRGHRRNAGEPLAVQIGNFLG